MDSLVLPFLFSLKIRTPPVDYGLDNKIGEGEEKLEKKDTGAGGAGKLGEGGWGVAGRRELEEHGTYSGLGQKYMGRGKRIFKKIA